MTAVALKNESIQSRLNDVKELIIPRLTQLVAESTQHSKLRQAMLHGVKGSGKFIRPFLTLIFAKSHKKLWSQEVIDTAIAIELLHSYSLIHDDLPAMDNADLRRGLPSCWKAFDEATAILAGDGLISLSFEILANLDTTAEIKLNLISEFAKATGPNGLVAGQMMDMFPASHISTTQEMQLLKTGELLSFSCMAGVILAGLKTDQPLKNARDFGLKLGLIYQITDDLLSEYGTAISTGKPVQNDQNKITFLSVLGTEGAKDLLSNLLNEAQELASTFDEKDILLDLLDFIAARTY